MLAGALLKAEQVGCSGCQHSLSLLSQESGICCSGLWTESRLSLWAGGRDAGEHAPIGAKTHRAHSCTSSCFCLQSRSAIDLVQALVEHLATCCMALQGGEMPIEAPEEAGVPRPRYEYSKKNIYSAGVPRPRKLPKDDVAVCNCRTCAGKSPLSC